MKEISALDTQTKTTEAMGIGTEYKCSLGGPLRESLKTRFLY